MRCWQISSSEGYRNAHQCGTDDHHRKTGCPGLKPGMTRKYHSAKKQRHHGNSIGDSQRRLHIFKDEKGNYDRESGQDDQDANTQCTQLGGLKHHVQEFNRNNARVQAGLLFLATVALLVPSVVADADVTVTTAKFTQTLSLGLSVLLIVTYGLGLLFTLKTHAEFFAGSDHADSEEAQWPLGLSLATLAGVTVLVALVSEVFVESVQQAATALGISPAFVGFIIVALVGGAAEMVSALSAARKNRLDLSVGIALGSASQIALFVAPVLVLASYVIGLTPMNLQFWPGAVAMILIATMTAALVSNTGRSAWFVGVLVVTVYLIFAMALYLLPPNVQ
jgi:Ca2+:H+ antiporter